MSTEPFNCRTFHEKRLSPIKMLQHKRNFRQLVPGLPIFLAILLSVIVLLLIYIWLRLNCENQNNTTMCMYTTSLTWSDCGQTRPRPLSFHKYPFCSLPLFVLEVTITCRDQKRQQEPRYRREDRVMRSKFRSLGSRRTSHGFYQDNTAHELNNSINHAK